MLARAHLAILAVTLMLFCASWGAGTGRAQEANSKPAVQDAQRRAFDEAIEQAKAATLEGPATVPLLDQGEVRLPAGYVFIPRAETAQLLRALGNNSGSNLLGMMLAQTDGLSWFAVLTFNKVGYIKDDDAKVWNADELLAQLREGTEVGNVLRAERGFPAIEVGGWIERPTYAADTHRLVWSALVKDKGAPPDEPASVNYNTYALGREGFLQLNLVTSTTSVDKDKPHAHALLSALAYNNGKRYEDFDKSTDHVAEYGLAALVAGAAAKKLGLFAVLAAILLKSWKLVVLALIGVGALLRYAFNRVRKPRAGTG